MPAAAVLLLACGDGAGPTSTVGVDADAPAPTEPGGLDPLPFDLGPPIERGGDDVVAPGFQIPERFIDAVAQVPDRREMVVYRWMPSPSRQEAVRAAVADLVGDPSIDLDIDGPRFSFEVGPAGASPTTDTTVPDPVGREPYDEAAARRRTLAFLSAAGFTLVADDMTPFVSGGYLSVEAGVELVPDTAVLQADVSLTFDADGRVIGGYGPVGEAVPDRTVAIVDVPAAINRLDLTTALAGYPTTFALPADPVTLVSAEVALSLREASVGGAVTDAWLIPVYRFVDTSGDEHEINAVVADELRIP